MFKPIVAVASLVTGAATAAVVVYMQTNPMAFTSASTNQWTPSAVTRPAPPPVYLDALVEEEAEGYVEAAVAPKPVPPKASAVVRKKATKPAEPAKLEPVLKPCSNEWRDVGVKSVAGPSGSEPRRVRQLCP